MSNKQIIDVESTISLGSEEDSGSYRRPETIGNVSSLSLNIEFYDLILNIEQK